MSNRNIIRAWKDAAYRKTLSASELAAVPANPAGAIEISDQDLEKVAGGNDAYPTKYYCTLTRTATCAGDCSSFLCKSINCPSRLCTVCGPVYSPK